MYQRKKRVTLDGQHSSWPNIEAEVPQGSILGQLFFLIRINNLSDGLLSNPKLLTNDTSLLSVVHNINSTANGLNNDVMKTSTGLFS